MAQMPIFVINMARETERMKSVASQLSHENLSYERFEAIDGRKISVAERRKLYSAGWYWLMHGKTIPPGEFGCILSHRTVFQKMIDENLPCALILEDDVIFRPGLSDRLTEIEAETRDFDMVQLFSFRQPERLVRSSKWGSFEIKKFHNLHAATAAYVMRLSGAKKIMRISKVRTNPDRWCWQSVMTGLKCCGITPMPIVLHEILSADSSLARINTDIDLPRAVKSGTPKFWKYMILPWLNLVKIGLLRARDL